MIEIALTQIHLLHNHNLSNVHDAYVHSLINHNKLYFLQKDNFQESLSQTFQYQIKKNLFKNINHSNNYKLLVKKTAFLITLS